MYIHVQLINWNSAPRNDDWIGWIPVAYLSAISVMAELVKKQKPVCESSQSQGTCNIGSMAILGDTLW